MDRERRGKAGNVKCYRCGEENPKLGAGTPEQDKLIDGYIRALADVTDLKNMLGLEQAKVRDIEGQVEHWRKAWAEAQVKADTAPAEMRAAVTSEQAQQDALYALNRRYHRHVAEQAVLDAMAAVSDDDCQWHAIHSHPVWKAELARRKAQP
jgi:hypothetical protein